MISVGLIIVICCLYIHLGMGHTLSTIFKKEWYIFKCVKCITWQSVLAYTLFFTEYDIIECFAISFVSAYIALWFNLLLEKLVDIYEKLSE